MAEFKKATQELKDTLNVDEDLKEIRDDLADTVSGIKHSIDEQESPYDEAGAVEDDPDIVKAEGIAGNGELPQEKKVPKYGSFDEVLDEFEGRGKAQDKEQDASEENDTPEENR
jgi:hypothetical protein